MTGNLKSKAKRFCIVLLILLVISPFVILSIQSVQDFALLEYHQMSGYPSLESLERVEGNLIKLSFCSGRPHQLTAKIKTSNGVVSLRTTCDIEKVAKRFFLKNEKVIAYKERLPSYILRPPNVVQLTVNDKEIFSYQSLIEYQTSNLMMFRMLDILIILMWIGFYWWGWRYYKKEFLNE